MSTFSKWSLPYKFSHFAMHATCLAYLFSSVRKEMCEVLTNVFFLLLLYMCYPSTSESMFCEHVGEPRGLHQG